MKRNWARRWIGRAPRGWNGLRARWRAATMGRRGWRKPFAVVAFVRGFPCWQVYLTLLVASLIVRGAVTSWMAFDDADLLETVEAPRMTASGPVGGKPVTLGYRAFGDPDNPVKIIAHHGSPTFLRSDYAALGPVLAEHAYVVAPVMPGYGESSRYVPDYGIKANARYALALMDELGIERAHVMGYSIGSGVALWMNELAPERVDSLIFYGGIGIQEGEGSGDYQFEHFKYRLGYLLLVVGGEMIPHFDLLGPLHVRHAFIRNFTDLDQRPLRGVLERLNDAKTPLLILQDHRDPFVPSNTAREHHDIVEHSELVVLDGAHDLIFDEAGSRQLAAEIVPFVRRFEDPAAVPERRTDDRFGAIVPPTLDLPFDLRLEVTREMGPWTQVGLIMAASYVWEDPTTVFTGILVGKGLIDPFVGLIAIFLGIFTGDLALYLIGRLFGQRALRWRIVEKRLPAHHVENLAGWLDRHGWTAVLASRFIPGTRVPLYVSAGALGRKPGRFALWTLFAVMLWAPVMLLLVVLLGDAALSQSRSLFGNNAFALIFTLVFVLFVVRVLTLATTKVGRGKLKAGFARLYRYEFWPAYAFYLPLIPVIARLALRHGGLRTLTAVNPAMPESGFIDESKIDILRALPPDAIVPSDAMDVPDADDDETVAAAVAELHALMQRRGWAYPLILKPDAGQRGFGVRKVVGDGDAREFFADVHGRVLVQTYDPGPFEAGVFYVRRPDEPRGRIFSVTDKVFPTVTGDGKHTLEELIYRHGRLRMQAGVFLARFADQRDDVLADGETRTLAVSGNHAQGTLFRDGAHLATDALAARIDAIARSYEGFFFGRFDVRYADLEAFRRGEGFAIVELNGVTSESTNLYDPGKPLWWAYGVLFAQWRWAFEIGAANRARGAAVTPLGKVWKKVRRHYKTRSKHGRAD